MFVEGADYHKLKNHNNDFVVLKELQIGELIQTKDGNSSVTSVELLNEKDMAIYQEALSLKQQTNTF
jgi:hypothetical protein